MNELNMGDICGEENTEKITKKIKTLKNHIKDIKIMIENQKKNYEKMNEMIKEFINNPEKIINNPEKFINNPEKIMKNQQPNNSGGKHTRKNIKKMKQINTIKNNTMKNKQ